MITTNVPKHLVVGARTNFLSALGDTASKLNDYKKFTGIIDLKAAQTDLVDLGSAPMPLRSLGKGVAQDFIEKAMSVKPLSWDITVWISKDTVSDDQTGMLESRVKGAGENFQRHISNLAFDALENGDSTAAYGACYDGFSFYNNAHIDAGANYTTPQDNQFNLALSIDNYETVRVAGMNFRMDNGEPYDYVHNLLVVNPSSEREAAQIANNPMVAGTTDTTNPYAGQVSYVTSPKITAGEWHAIDATRRAKPILLGMREKPHLQDSWFDPEAADGGRYYFKFYARYVVAYGLWALAIKGK